MSIQNMKGQKIFCAACKKHITGGRTVIEGAWHCADCTYKHDYPDKTIPEPAKPPKNKQQVEKLFEVPVKGPNE